MAIANPLLAVWDVDGVLRTFEYTSGAFVQIGTLGGLTHNVSATALAAGADPAPALCWDWNDSYIVITYAATANRNLVYVFSPLLATMGAVYLQASSTNIGGGRTVSFEDQHEHYHIPSIAQQRMCVKVSEAGVPTLVQTFNGTTVGLNVTGMAMAEDGEYMMHSFADAATKPTRLYKRASAPGATPNFVQQTNPPFITNSQQVRFSYNDRSVLTLDTTFGVAKIWTLVADVWTFLQDLPLPTGTVQKSQMSPDTKMLAVSVLSGGVYTTRIYRRVGDYFQFHQDLTGIGKLLDWTADGILLVDSGLKAAYIRFGETFIENNASMTNIPSLVQAQALSKGRVYPYGFAKLYNAAIEDLAEYNVDFNDLKMTLLKDTASFDETHTSLSQVTGSGAYEVNTGLWPAGGVDLTNVSSADNGVYYDFTADPVKWIPLASTLVARYGVIYEATSSRPLIFIDFLNQRAVVQGRQMVIDFQGGSFLRFSK